MYLAKLTSDAIKIEPNTVAFYSSFGSIFIASDVVCILINEKFKCVL